eukprot:552148-Hanusia_phi.AAC.1
MLFEPRQRRPHPARLDHDARDPLEVLEHGVGVNGCVHELLVGEGGEDGVDASGAVLAHEDEGVESFGPLGEERLLRLVVRGRVELHAVEEETSDSKLQHLLVVAQLDQQPDAVPGVSLRWALERELGDEGLCHGLQPGGGGAGEAEEDRDGLDQLPHIRLPVVRGDAGEALVGGRLPEEEVGEKVGHVGLVQDRSAEGGPDVAAGGVGILGEPPPEHEVLCDVLGVAGLR